MNSQTRLTLAGAVVLALAGAAHAAGANTHRLDVALPDGGVAHIEYIGDVAPKVSVSRAAPVAWSGDTAPFAMFDRIAADMDRQMRAVMARANAAQPFARLDQASPAKLPPGTVSYSFVSTSNGKGVCSRSVQVTSAGTGKPPKVVQQVSGDCNVVKEAERTPSLAATTPAPARATARSTI